MHKPFYNSINFYQPPSNKTMYHLEIRVYVLTLCSRINERKELNRNELFYFLSKYFQKWEEDF